MKYRILIETIADDKSVFVDADLPIFEADDSAAIMIELDRLKAETGVCHAAESAE